MKMSEKVELVEDWAARMADMEAALDALRPVIGVNPESQLVTGIFSIQRMLTHCVAIRAGVDYDLLELIWLDCGLDPAQAMVQLKDGTPIDTWEKLVWTYGEVLQA